MKNNFKCKSDDKNYCKLWLRQCVGAENCKQALCPYCVNGGISPTKRICVECKHGEWKKDNYIE